MSRSQHDKYFSWRRRRELAGKPFISMDEYYRLESQDRLKALNLRLPYQRLYESEGIDGLREKRIEILRSILTSKSELYKARLVKIEMAISLWEENHE